LTGDFLFDPQQDNNGRYSRDEDHLAMIIELLGPLPKRMTTKGKASKQFFRKGLLRNIRDLSNYWPLESVLTEKYGYSQQDAKEISDFLLPMLELDPRQRISASACLKSKWLDEIRDKEDVDLLTNAISSMSVYDTDERSRRSLSV